MFTLDDFTIDPRFSLTTIPKWVLQGIGFQLLCVSLPSDCHGYRDYRDFFSK